MFEVIVGHSNEVTSEEAIADVLAQCNQQLARRLNNLSTSTSPQAGILLSAIDFEHSLILARIQAAFPDIALIGGTTDGEVSSVMGFQEDSLVLVLFCSDTIEIKAGLGRGLSKDAIAAAKQSINDLALEPDTLATAKLCVTIPDGLESGTEVALRQLQQQQPPNIPIVGGRTGDQ